MNLSVPEVIATGDVIKTISTNSTGLGLSKRCSHLIRQLGLSIGNLISVLIITEHFVTEHFVTEHATVKCPMGSYI